MHTALYIIFILINIHHLKYCVTWTKTLNTKNFPRIKEFAFVPCWCLLLLFCFVFCFFLVLFSYCQSNNEMIFLCNWLTVTGVECVPFDIINSQIARRTSLTLCWMLVHIILYIESGIVYWIHLSTFQLPKEIKCQRNPIINSSRLKLLNKSKSDHFVWFSVIWQSFLSHKLQYSLVWWNYTYHNNVTKPPYNS